VGHEASSECGAVREPAPHSEASPHVNNLYGQNT
jgi:hypothetical protein